ncbi:MAG: type III-B CRISPR-associated protein Cas10/Cmr2, partial [Candidatus Electrothrix sp.]
LDVLGLVKRLAGDNPDQFTPTTRIAIDPWIRKVIATPDGEGSIKAIKKELEKLADLESDLITHVKGNKGIYSALPFDGGQLYQGVLDTLLGNKELKGEKPKEYNILKYLQRKILPDVRKNHGQPCPYYAMLLADGDHMGNLIKAAEGKKQHQEISKCLSAFAQGVPAIARGHQAHCIYAGGDDVLLMAPLDTVLPLADKLRTAFTEKLQKVADDLGKKAPTFSVGIVIAHMQTPIGRVRKLVSKAESLAKGSDTESPRNALAIIVAPRSGADIPFRARWEKEPVNGLNKLANLYRNDKLPSGFGYELRQIDQLVHDMEDKARAGEIAELELERILNRKNQGGGGKKVEQKTKDAVLDHAKSKGSFTMIWQEHLIARWLGAHGEERG